MWRASCLAWYSIILQPTLCFPAIPRGTRWPQVHKSDCAIHWFHSNQRYCFSQPHFRLLASPPRSRSPLLSSNWKCVLLYIVVKSQHPILNLVLHCCKCTVIHKIDINSFAYSCKISFACNWKNYVTERDHTLSWTATVVGPQRSSRWRKELEPFFFKIWKQEAIIQELVRQMNLLKGPLMNMEHYHHISSNLCSLNKSMLISLIIGVVLAIRLNM